MPLRTWRDPAGAVAAASHADVVAGGGVLRRSARLLQIDQPRRHADALLRSVEVPGGQEGVRLPRPRAGTRQALGRGCRSPGASRPRPARWSARRTA